MKFTVIWTNAAEESLATVWTDADDRKAVTSAAHAIDGLLAQKPESVGRVCFDTVRSFSVPPLGVDYEVIDADRVRSVGVGRPLGASLKSWPELRTAQYCQCAASCRDFSGAMNIPQVRRLPTGRRQT